MEGLDVDEDAAFREDVKTVVSLGILVELPSGTAVEEEKNDLLELDEIDARKDRVDTEEPVAGSTEEELVWVLECRVEGVVAFRREGETDEEAERVALKVGNFEKEGETEADGEGVEAKRGLGVTVEE